ncbi:MAG TPA: M13 family metallopeptidase [Rhodanobacteraceae bacterium]
MILARAAVPVPETACRFDGAPEPIRFDVRDLDPAADPRVDLDAFVNARWRAANPVPPDRSSWDGFAILTERALCLEADIAAEAAAKDAPAGSVERIVGDFWRSGIEATPEAGIDRLGEELACIDRLDTPASIAAYLRDRHARGLGIVFGFAAEPDFAAPERTIACVTQGGLGLPDRDDYFDASPRGIARRRAYVAHVATLLELTGSDGATALADDVLGFETRLAAASTSRRTLARDIGARYRPIDIEAADRAMPLFPWSLFFRALGIEPPGRFSLAMPDFHAAVNESLRALPASIWRAYLRFHTIDDAARFLDDEFFLAHHRFHGEVLRGRKTPAPRWKRVVETIDSQVGEAMGQLFVARSFAPAAKQQVLGIAETLRAALRARLEHVPWMSDETRHGALAKLESLTFKIGYPDKWRDWSTLATSPRSLYDNALAARGLEHQQRVERIGQPTDRTLWPMPPQTVNAGYDPQRNEIVFPAAILAPPFFDPAADVPLQYGGIGAVIAHEMIHGYDDQGSRFGADGSFSDWWTSQDRERFDALTTRLIERFDRWPAGGCDPLDGRLTLGENVADFGGLAVACDALLDACRGSDDPMIDGHPRLQRFFFAWATLWRQNLTFAEACFRLRNDPHAPASVRANAAPANLAAYADAFDCHPGDPMHVAERIGIW